MAEQPDPEGKSSLAPAPRRNTSVERPANPTSPEAMASFANSIKVLAEQLGDSSAEAAHDETDRTVRRRMKFQRKGAPEGRRVEAVPVEPVHGNPPEGHDDPADESPAEDLIDGQEAKEASALNKSIAWPRLPSQDAPSQKSARAKRKQQAAMIPLLVLMACNLGMLVFGYWLGQSAASGTQPRGGANDKTAQIQDPNDPLAPPGVSDKALDAASLALKTEKSDLNTARRLYDEAVRQHLSLPGIEYRLALLAVQRGDLLDADLHLVHSTEAGECVAPCYYIRATFAGAKGNFTEASRALDAAVRAEPFTAKYYFFRGETLRREGKPHAAAASLEQALARAYSPEEGDLYLFKLGLSKIEFDHNVEFSASIESHLQHQPVSGDWLLLAAAQDLERSDFPVAAEHLRLAAQVMPPALFASRVRDYFFQAYANKPGVTEFLNRPVAPEETEAGPSVMDPASWSAEKADPGAWPIISATAH